jgi:hypothetical protein
MIVKLLFQFFFVQQSYSFKNVIWEKNALILEFEMK